MVTKRQAREKAVKYIEDIKKDKEVTSIENTSTALALMISKAIDIAQDYTVKK